MKLQNGRDLQKSLWPSQACALSIDVSGGDLLLLNSVLRKSAEVGQKVYLSSTPSSIESGLGFGEFSSTILKLAKNYDVGFAIHLDHCSDIDTIRLALDNGFTSIMYDGSSLPFKENVHKSYEVVRICEQYYASVEGELGIIKGKEDHIENSNFKYPSIEKCHVFVEETGIDIFAPAIGTVHGLEATDIDIQWSLVEGLSKIEKPLCLHGCSGLPAKTFTDLLGNGFLKANFASELRKSYKRGIIKGIDATQESPKPQEIYKYVLAEIDLTLSELFKLAVN